MPPMLPEILHEADVAVMLSCAVSTVQELARKGTLPATRFGDGWVFPRLQLVACVTEIAVAESAGRWAERYNTPKAVAKKRERREPPELPSLH